MKRVPQVRRPFGFMLAVSWCLSASVAAQNEESQSRCDAILGEWITDDGRARVEIYKETDAGGATRYFGKIAWLRAPLYDGPGPEHGDPLRDANNPDSERQHDPILGMVILKDFEFDERKERWINGTVYDPENGETYKSTMKLRASAGDPSQVELRFRGYIFVSLIGRSTVWKRAPELAKSAENGAVIP